MTKWTVPVGVHSLAIGADGTIYMTALDGTLRALGADGAEAWALPSGSFGGAPVIGGDGTLYVSRVTGAVQTLLAIGP